MGAAGLVCCADNAAATMRATTVPMTSAIRTLIRLFGFETAGEAFDLVAGRKLPRADDLLGRGHLRIHLDLRAAEAAQRALRRGVHDAAVLHVLRHEIDGILVNDDGVVRHERADADGIVNRHQGCLLYTSPSPRDS